MNTAVIGCICGLFSAFVAIGTLIYKYARIVAMVEGNKKEIQELKKSSSEYQNTILTVLNDIKVGINTMNVSLAVLKSRLDYIEKEQLKG